jgi:predicted RND superfamily exporter protein
MNSENDLMQKLMMSKKIMEKHNEIGRGQSRNMTMSNDHSSPVVENYEAPAAKYNLPSDLLEDTRQSTQPKQYNLPMEDRIANSKLPDEIKKLMMEHPIQQPNMGMSTETVLSNDLIERASRLMNTNPKNNQITEGNPKQTKQSSVGLSKNDIRDIVRETVEDVLKENGLLVESESKSNDLFKFRVGQHLFEGKVLNVKKMSK